MYEWFVVQSSDLPSELLVISVLNEVIKTVSCGFVVGYKL